MASLPLKAKVAVRDHWTNEESAARKAIKHLKDVLGLDVDIEPEWQLLLAELDAEYADKGDFAAAVAGTVETWCKATTDLLDDHRNAEWTDALLEKLNATQHRLRAFVEVSSDEHASTTWSEERGAFIIALPRRQITHPAQLYPLFKGEVRDCFADHKQLPPYTISSGDEWADVGMEHLSLGDHHHNNSTTTTTNGRRPVSPHNKTAVTSTATPVGAHDFLPRADALPRPDDLLNKPPYHLFVYAKGPHEIEIQGSHSATLKFLAEYFKKWRRVNHQLSSKPPAVEVKLHQSAFGLGAIIDRVVLVAENRSGTFTITPTIVLSLVEGVLGYKPVYSDAHSWTFRRDVELRSM